MTEAHSFWLLRRLLRYEFVVIGYLCILFQLHDSIDIWWVRVPVGFVLGLLFLFAFRSDIESTFEAISDERKNSKAKP